MLDIYDTRSERLNWELRNGRADTTRSSRRTNHHLQPSHRWGRFPFIVMGGQIGPRTGINIVKICTNIQLNYISICVRIFFLWSLANSRRQQTCRHPGLTVSPLRSAQFHSAVLLFIYFSAVYSALSYTNARTPASSSWLPWHDKEWMPWPFLWYSPNRITLFVRRCFLSFFRFLSLLSALPHVSRSAGAPCVRSCKRYWFTPDPCFSMSSLNKLSFHVPDRISKGLSFGFFWFTHRWKILSVFSPVLFIHLFLFRNVQITGDLLF